MDQQIEDLLDLDEVKPEQKPTGPPPVKPPVRPVEPQGEVLRNPEATYSTETNHAPNRGRYHPLNLIIPLSLLWAVLLFWGLYFLSTVIFK